MLALYTRFTVWLQSFEGQSLVEYALILVLVSILLIVGLNVTKNALSSTFSHIGSSLASR